MDGFGFSATLSAGFGFWASASPAMPFANSFSFNRWCAALKFSAGASSLTLVALNSTAKSKKLVNHVYFQLTSLCTL
jgi:hypothetical protein